ncbi:MAG: hypothetical protein PVH11_06150 [Anaerolineae bacterium]|jgi:hypothetical protein
MNYGKVLTRAWEITWRWKALWILGFLAALGRAGGTSGNSGYSFDEGDMPIYVDKVPPEVIGLIVAVACVAIIIAIAIWVVSVIARAGLIAGVQQVEDEGAMTFGSAWRVGVSRFWTVFGIGILAALPLILAGIVGAIVLAAVIAGGALVPSSEGGKIAGIVIPSIFCGGTFCCLMIILGVVLGQIRVYAERAAVLEGLGWIDAFKRGWDVLKDNLGPTVVYWLLFLALGLIVGVVIFAVAMAFILPFVGIISNVDLGGWVAAPLCCGGLLAIIIGALISALIEVFTSATWTLAYREMTGVALEEAVAPIEE